MAGKADSKTKKIVRAAEVLLALFLLLAIIELLLIRRSPQAGLPEVRLIERTVDTVVVTLPPGATTNANILKATDTNQSPVIPRNRPETVTITRSVPPVLAFENVRRFLGLLGPAQPDTIMAYRRIERQHTVEFPGQAQMQTVNPAAGLKPVGSELQINSANESKATASERPKTATGDPFRISLPQ